MGMQNFWGVKEVHYGVVQVHVVNATTNHFHPNPRFNFGTLVNLLI